MKKLLMGIDLMTDCTSVKCLHHGATHLSTITVSAVHRTSTSSGSRVTSGCDGHMDKDSGISPQSSSRRPIIPSVAEPPEIPNIGTGPEGMGRNTSSTFSDVSSAVQHHRQHMCDVALAKQPFNDGWI